MFVPSPQCIAIPYTLCIWIFPLWPPDSVSPGFILRFCLLYTPFLSAHILCFSRLLLCFCRLIYSVSLLFNPFPCMEMPLLSCISKSIIHPSLFHFPHILSALLSPSVAVRHFFRVLPYRFHCALPSSFLPCSRLPHLVINRVLLPIPVLVGRLKPQSTERLASFHVKRSQPLCLSLEISYQATLSIFFIRPVALSVSGRSAVMFHPGLILSLIRAYPTLIVRGW